MATATLFTVSELAERSGLSPHTVRYYLREALIKPTAHGDNQYRLFTDNDVQRLRFIRSAKTLGFTLNDIRQILAHAQLGESPCGEVREIIQQHIADNRRKIEELQQLQARMEAALETWQDMPNRTPDGHSICHLIESMGKD